MPFIREWYTISEFPGYEISNVYDVRNKKTQRILTPHRNQNGNVFVVLRDDDGRQRSRSVKKLLFDNWPYLIFDMSKTDALVYTPKHKK